MKFKMWTKTLLILTLVLSFGLPAANVKIKILKQTSQYVHLQIHFDEPQWIPRGTAVLASYSDAAFTQDAHQNVVPVVVQLLNLSPTHALPVKILHLQTEVKTVKQYVFNNSVSSEQQAITQARNWVQTKYLGLMGDFPLHALHIFPVRVSSDHQQVTFLKSIELTIGSPTAAAQNMPGVGGPSKKTAIARVLEKVVLNKEHQLYVPEQFSRTLSTSATQTSKLQQWQTILQNDIVFKMVVDQDGLYKVTYEDLLKAGVPLPQIDPQNLHLYNKGKEIPIYFKGEQDHEFNEEDYFEFWGERNKRTFQKQFPELYADPFSDQNVYWLVYQNTRGARLVEESGGINSAANELVISPFAFRDTLHFEKNAVAHKFGHTATLVNRPAYEIDTYYYDKGISSPGGVGYDFEVPDPAEYGAEVVVKAMFRGKSFFDYLTNPIEGHKVTLKLRGKDNVAYLVGRVDVKDGWKDQETRIITNADSVIKIDQSALNNGLNRLEVDMFQTGVSDIVVLNWFEISYLRKYRAHNNFLKFHVDRDFFDGRFVRLGDRIQFNVDGFTSKDIDVYKIGISKITNVDTKPVKDETTNKFSFGISFQDEVVDPSTKYIALTESQKKKVLKIEAFRPWKTESPQASLLSTTNKADYLIITHDLFAEECKRLQSLKQAAGFQPEVVTVRDIYDLFNYGIKSPLAIKAFIGYVYENWDASAPLEYVVLVGDAVSDYRSENDLVPTIFYNSVKFGATESDYQYALLKGDDYLPEVIVARIPARTVYELQNYLDKIEHFPEQPTGQWVNQTLFISGSDGATEYLTDRPIFRAQNLRLINYRIPQTLFAAQINSLEDPNIPNDPHFGNNRDVINAFNNGLVFVNFVGHGGGAIWADAGLMGLEDVEQLANGYKLPFVSSLTCFTGSFANPQTYSLGEKMVLSAQKGAIGFLGSSGVGWLYNDFAIAWGLPDYLWNDAFTFGEAINLMKLYYMANPFYYTEEGRFYTFGYGGIVFSQVSQYNYFGDPALKMPQVKEQLTIKIEPEIVLPGDSVALTISQFPQPANVAVQVSDEANYLVFSKELTDVSAPVRIGLRVPATLPAQQLRVKVFAGNQSQSASGFARIAVAQPLVKQVLTEPADLSINQPVVFKVVLKADKAIRQVTITNLYDENSFQNYNVNLTLAKLNDTTYISQPFAGFGKGGNKIFDVVVATEDGKTIVERWKKIYVYDPRPDLLVEPQSVGWGGQSSLSLKFKIKNHSEHAVQNVRVACYDNVISNDQPFAMPEVALAEAREKWVEVPLPEDVPYQAYHQIKIVVDADSLYEERDEDNNQVNTTLFQNALVITPDLGTSLNGQVHQVLDLGDHWQFEVQPQATNKAFVLRFEKQNISGLIARADQNDLKPVLLAEQQDTTGLVLSFSEVADLKVQSLLTLQLDSIQHNYPKERIFIYRYDPVLNAWSALPSTWSGNVLQATVDASGIFAPFYTTDDNEPLLEISVNGRPLISNMLVPHKPTVGILLQDVNGVDFNRSLDLKIDEQFIVKNGQLLDKGVTLPDSSSNVKNIQIVFTPELSPGKHNLFLKVSDVNGNVAQKNITFTVADGFDLIVYGNYPNPFKERTIISYYIESNEQIDELSIKIYTTSGRLIRSKMLDLDPTILDDNLKEPNYHELIWDGTDDDGNQVANGVYFAIIRAKYRGKTIKQVLKMARLR